MIPNNSLTPDYIPEDFLYPDNLTVLPNFDYELGGIALSNPSKGLEYQVWTAQIVGTGSDTGILVESENGFSSIIFSSPNITWVRLTFDQNMHPFLSFVDYLGAGYYWWDPTIPGLTTSYLDPAVQYASCSLDDKRPAPINNNLSDIILSYVLNGNLCFRMERDRYNVEYVLRAGLGTIVPNPNVFNIGMGTANRLLFMISASIYA